MKKILLAFLVMFTFVNCKENQHTHSYQDNAPTGFIPTSWVEERVQEAEVNLLQTEGGKIVWKAMEAAGGLRRWYSNGPIGFQFDYKPLGNGTRRNTSQLVDTWSNKAVHTDAIDKSAKFGWDGKNAWVTEKDTANFDYNLRFWALTPIYFLAQPFNFDGQGVIIEKLEDKFLHGESYHAVKISYEAGTGDAPDDFYINYYDKETYQLKALRYIVSYPKYFKDGGHSPEKIMILEDFTTVEGIKLPTGYNTYMLTDDEAPGKHVTEITVSEIAFFPTTDKSAFSIPKDGFILEGL